MPQHTPIHLSIKGTCERHNCNRTYLYELAGEGKILLRKSGRRTLVDVASADAHFASLPHAQIKAPAVTSAKPAIARA